MPRGIPKRGTKKPTKAKSSRNRNAAAKKRTPIKRAKRTGT